MLHMNAFVKNLAEPNRDRFHDAKQTIESGRPEIRIVNEVVGYAVDVPGNANGINKPKDEHHPKRYAWKKIKHAEEVSAVEKAGSNRNRVPARVRKDPGVRPGAFDTYELA